MSKQVDVLATLEDAADYFDDCGRVFWRRKILDVRAAITELIAAAKVATEERFHDGASSRAACDRLVAALIAVQGPQA